MIQLVNKETRTFTRVEIGTTLTTVFEVDKAEDLDRFSITVENLAESAASLNQAVLQTADKGQYAAWTTVDASPVTTAFGTLAADTSATYKTGTVAKKRVRLQLKAATGGAFVTVSVKATKLPLDADDVTELLYLLDAGMSADTLATIMTGFVAGAGVEAATDTLLQIINKLAGNVATKVDGLAGVKVYRALLTQEVEDAPTATVLENSLGGTVVWTRDGIGQYTGTLTGAFTANKTMVFNQTVSDLLDFQRIDANSVRITTTADEILFVTSFQILVYP